MVGSWQWDNGSPKQKPDRISAIMPDRLYTDNELSRYFEWSVLNNHNPYWHDKDFLIRLIFGTGLRVSECLRLRVPEDCLSTGVIIVRTSKTGRPRTVMVSPELEPFYRARLYTIEPGQRLFLGITCKETLEHWWQEALAAAGVEYRRGRCCHAGRHQWATEELSSGRLKGWQVQAQLGHKSLEMTLAKYVHAIAERYYLEDKRPTWWAVALSAASLRVVKERTT